MGNRFNIRIEGTRIKHTMGPVSLKLYDKFGLILRIETTVNDLTFFKHYREVEHRDGTRKPNGRPCRKPSTACPPCGNCWKPPTGATWSSCPPSKIPATAETNSTSSRSQCKTRAAATPDSICSTPTMKPVQRHRARRVQHQRHAEQNPAPISAGTRTADKCPGSSSAFAFTVSSKRSATPTSTT